MNRIIIYGFGGLGEKFFNYIINKNFQIISILDKGKKGQRYNQIDIIEPELSSIKNIPVIITILNEYVDIYEVKEYLLKLGFEKVYTIFEALQKFELFDFEHLFIKHPIKIEQSLNNDIVNNVKKLFSDELSKNIFEAVIDFRKTFNYKIINNFYDSDMYLPDMIMSEIIKRKTINVLDLGACYGDLIDIFSNKNLKIDNYYAFEPDSSNLLKLRNKIADNDINGCVLPMGVGNFDGFIGFNSGSGTGSNIDINSENKIMVSKVDSVIMSKIDFVKMDIEGFEKEALSGMKELITKSKPILAISIYHKPLDFIDIPLSLSRRDFHKYLSECTENMDSILSCMQYEKFYIRYHGSYGFEFVLYAF